MIGFPSFILSSAVPGGWAGKDDETQLTSFWRRLKNPPKIVLNSRMGRMILEKPPKFKSCKMWWERGLTWLTPQPAAHWLGGGRKLAIGREEKVILSEISFFSLKKKSRHSNTNKPIISSVFHTYTLHMFSCYFTHFNYRFIEKHENNFIAFPLFIKLCIECRNI